LTIDRALGSQIKFAGENSFAVKLSEQVIGMDPQIMPSIIDKPIPSFLDGNKTYFDELYNFIFIEPLKKIGLFLWKKGDINTIDRYGPDGLSRLVKIISDKAVHFQSGYLYHYAFVMLIGFSILLTYLILY